MKSTMFLLFGMIFTSFAFAQNHYPVIEMHISTTPIAGNIVNGVPEISDSTTFQVTMHIMVLDTTVIQTLAIVLKKDSTSSTLISKIFDFDVVGTFTDNTSYSRTIYEITLGLGNYQGLYSPYGELIVHTATSTTDPIIYF